MKSLMKNFLLHQKKLNYFFSKVVSTRWNSTLTMLKSLSVNLVDLRAFAAELNDKSLQKSLLDVNDDLLGEVIDVLEPFDEATRY